MNDDMFAHEEQLDEILKPKNENLIHGLKKQNVQAFVRYLKETCPGEVGADLSITIQGMTFTELDKLAERFLGEDI